MRVFEHASIIAHLFDDLQQILVLDVKAVLRKKISIVKLDKVNSAVL